MNNVRLVLFLGCFLAIGEMAVAKPPRQVVAGSESTVYGIAYDNGIPTQRLLDANPELTPPYVLSPGQVLILPSPGEHIVRSGETLKDIADKHGVKVDVLAQENDVRAVKQGERLLIPPRDTESVNEALRPPAENITTSSLDPLPSVKTNPAQGKARASLPSNTPLPPELAEEIAREKGGAHTVQNTSDVSAKPMLMGNLTQGNAGAPTAATTPLRDETPEETPKKEVKKEAQKKAKSADKPVAAKTENKGQEKKPESKKEESQADAKQPQFIWPVKGTVLSKFNPGKNDGIKIKIPEGTAIKAAAAGEVLYAGSELKGFGNLLLLKHQGGWVTAYAYNSSLLVKKGDKIKQGQVIAKSGKTGDAKEPQLHFEVRKGKQPVDPLTQLGS